MTFVVFGAGGVGGYFGSLAISATPEWNRRSFFYGSFMDDYILKHETARRHSGAREVAVFVLRHHTRTIANQDASVYSTRCSAAYAVYREDQWQRRSKHTELES